MQLKARFWQPASTCIRRSHGFALAGLITLGLVLMFGSTPAHAAQLTASWSDATPDDHTGFKVERKTGTTGAFAQVTTTGPTVMSYIDTTMTAGTTYCYRVRAYNTAGDSAYTPEGCAVAPTPVVRTLTVAKSGTGTGTVDSSPGGITCGTTCSATYTSGTTVALSSTPTTGSTFTGWSGACTGTGGCTVVLDADKSATAAFALATYALTVTKAGTGTGTVTSNTGGINCGSTCSASYAPSTSVTLTAAATTGSTFSGWSGACTGTGSCVVSMTAAQAVTATFIPTTYALTVTKAGTGTGTVTSNTGGINCGSTCTASYTSGTSVTLTAAAATGSTFSGWSGACTGTGSCVVSVTAGTSVMATFTGSAPTTYALSVAKSGTGTGTVTSSPTGITCGSTCSASYTSGTSVTLTAAAASGSTFTGWSGACSGTGSCVVAVDSAKSVTATFTLQTFALTVTKNGTGSGAVTSSPAGVDCGATCSVSYPSGTAVTLTATPAAGSTFTGWSGACAGTGPCTLTMSQARDATATFTATTTTGAGLVAAYSFSEGSGKTVADASGKGHTGTITGASWTSAGKFGSALRFDGRNDVVTINDSTLLDLTSGLTISAWVYPTTAAGTRTVVLKERSGGLAYGLYANDNTAHPAGKVNTGGVDTGMSGSTSLPLNTWSHLATTYDGVALSLFVNGVQVGSRAVSGAIVTSAGVLRIGGNSVWGQYFRGRIDEVRIYNRPLGIAEIQQDMQTPVR